jgi:cytochrome c556
MKRWQLGLSAVLAAVVVTALPVRAAEQESSDPVVQYRRDVMKGIGANAAAIGQILRSNLPQTQNIALHAQVISLSARAALTAFEPKVVDGAAKPAVWDNWKDFVARLNKLAAAADEVSKAAQAGGLDAAKPKIDLLLPMCKNCHDTYKKK